jgi:hypothetical protein
VPAAPPPAHVLRENITNCQKSSKDWRRSGVSVKKTSLGWNPDVVRFLEHWISIVCARAHRSCAANRHKPITVSAHTDAWAKEHHCGEQTDEKLAGEIIQVKAKLG